MHWRRLVPAVDGNGLCAGHAGWLGAPPQSKQLERRLQVVNRRYLWSQRTQCPSFLFLDDYNSRICLVVEVALVAGSIRRRISSELANCFNFFSEAEGSCSERHDCWVNPLSFLLSVFSGFLWMGVNSGYLGTFRSHFTNQEYSSISLSHITLITRIL